jgi:hypothetical protein
MATNSKGSGKSRSVPKPEPISLKEELEAEEAAAEPAPVEIVAAEPVEVATLAPEPLKPAPAAEPAVAGTAVAVSVVAPGFGQEKAAEASRTPDLDPSQWSLKTLDLFNENAAAVLDLALALGKARSVSDAIEAQSRFASERYSSLVKQTNEFVELTRRFALEASAAPVRLSISAFVA